ncbi:hypothetical protein Vi05172_g1599 [Venturia inaequalis]|nr:hypothetical protein Vi05172_g1599 [Venturia inaequalis]
MKEGVSRVKSRRMQMQTGSAAQPGNRIPKGILTGHGSTPDPWSTVPQHDLCDAARESQCPARKGIAFDSESSMQVYGLHMWQSASPTVGGMKMLPLYSWRCNQLL